MIHNHATPPKLNIDNITIKYQADFSIIGVMWFVTARIDKVKGCGQSRCKENAKSIAIQRLSKQYVKK